jgi:hypothetical protein
MMTLVVFFLTLSASLSEPICAAGMNDFGAYAGPGNEWIGPNNPDTCDLESMPGPMSVYETQGKQIAACMEYGRTGDERAIQVYLGVDGSGSEVVGTLACDDYSEDVLNEPAFQAWYATTAKMLRLNADPDDVRHCYNYRAFFQAMQKGEVKGPTGPGFRFPSRWELTCHDRT